MSGKKCSSFVIKADLEERIDLIRTIVEHEKKVQALKEMLNNILQKASEGLRSTFRKEIGLVENWLKKIGSSEAKDLQENMVLSKLREDNERLESLVCAGGSLIKILSVAFTEKANDMGRKLSEDLSELETLYVENRELFALWSTERERQTLQQFFLNAHNDLSEERYKKLTNELNEFDLKIRQQIRLAEEKEERHQKRLYVLKAINKVCKGKGFIRIEDPRLEDDNDRGSRIKMKFDTVTQGEIEFSLTLDRIHADSQVADSDCFEEFDDLSAALEDIYGVKTEFRLSKDGSRPVLRTAKGLGERQSEVSEKEVDGHR